MTLVNTAFPRTPTRNGNDGNGRGHEVVRECGLSHRTKMPRDQRIKTAADVATGKLTLVPSMAHLADAFDITGGELREELRERAQAAGQQDVVQDIVDAWTVASPAERELAVRTIGLEEVWSVVAAAL